MPLTDDENWIKEMKKIDKENDSMELTDDEIIEVKFQEIDQTEKVLLVERAPEAA